MARTVESYRVFVASAGDVQPERDAVKDAVERINNTVGDATGKHLELWRWEERSVPGLHKGGPQKLINPDLDEADVVVIIIWNRIGAGTAEEVKRSIARWQTSGTPRVMVYFSAVPSVLTSRRALDDRGKVLDLQTQLQPMGLYEEYDSVDAFANTVHRHLTQVLMGL